MRVPVRGWSDPLRRLIVASVRFGGRRSHTRRKALRIRGHLLAAAPSVIMRRRRESTHTTWSLSIHFWRRTSGKWISVTCPCVSLTSSLELMPLVVSDCFHFLPYFHCLVPLLVVLDKLQRTEHFVEEVVSFLLVAPDDDQMQMNPASRRKTLSVVLAEHLTTWILSSESERP